MGTDRAPTCLRQQGSLARAADEAVLEDLEALLALHAGVPSSSQGRHRSGRQPAWTWGKTMLGHEGRHRSRHQPAWSWQHSRPHQPQLTGPLARHRGSWQAACGKEERARLGARCPYTAHLGLPVAPHIVEAVVHVAPAILAGALWHLAGHADGDAKLRSGAGGGPGGSREEGEDQPAGGMSGVQGAAPS